MNYDYIHKLPMPKLQELKGECEKQRLALVGALDDLEDMLRSIPQETTIELGDSTGEYDEHETFILVGMRVAYVNCHHALMIRLNRCRDKIRKIDQEIETRYLYLDGGENP